MELLANFLLFDAQGHLVLDGPGNAIVDLSHATPEQMGALAGLETDQSGGFKLKLRDPVRYLKLLARNRGLLRDKILPTNAGDEGPARVVISDRPMSDEEFARACVRPE